MLADDKKGGKGGKRGGKGGDSGPTSELITQLAKECPNAQIAFFSATFENKAKILARKIAAECGSSRNRASGCKEILLEAGEDSVTYPAYLFVD